MKSKKAEWTMFEKMAIAIVSTVALVLIVSSLAGHVKGATSPQGKLLLSAQNAALQIPSAKDIAKAVSGSCYPDDAAFFSYGTIGVYYSDKIRGIGSNDNREDCLFSPPSHSYGNANYNKIFYVSQQFACPSGMIVTDVDYAPAFADNSDTFSLFMPSQLHVNANGFSIDSRITPDRDKFSVNLPAKGLNTNAVQFMFGVEHKATHSFSDKKGAVVTNIVCA